MNQPLNCINKVNLFSKVEALLIIRSHRQGVFTFKLPVWQSCPHNSFVTENRTLNIEHFTSIRLLFWHDPVFGTLFRHMYSFQIGLTFSVQVVFLCVYERFRGVNVVSKRTLQDAFFFIFKVKETCNPAVWDCFFKIMAHTD